MEYTAADATAAAAAAETRRRQAVTQTKMDVQRNGNRHPAITHKHALSQSIQGEMATETPNKPKS